MKLSTIQSRALFKIAVDLVKSDSQIHCDEIAELQKLQENFNLDIDETEMIHYLTLQDAISILSSLDDDSKRNVLKLLENLIKVDNDVDFHESLLLCGIKLCLINPIDSKIISSQNLNFDCDQHQIVYLEHQFCSDAHAVLDDKYDYLMLSNILSNCQMQLFYLPHVMQLLSEGDADKTTKVLRKSIEYIVPFSHTNTTGQFRNSLQEMDVVRFTKLVETQANIRPEQIGMDAFLMVALQDSFVLDDEENRHRTRDFLCINVTISLKSKVLQLVEQMQSSSVSINYYGYYRLLFDFLNADVRLMSKILINHHLDFVLPDLGNQYVRFKSAPQAKTFYLLLVYYNKGIAQSLWNASKELCNQLAERKWVDTLDLKIALTRQTNPPANLVYNIIAIYESISNRSADPARLLEYVRSIILHRSSLKNYINMAINQIEQLANKDFYLVEFDSWADAYRLQINADWLQMQSDNDVIPLSSSFLWSKLR